MTTLMLLMWMALLQWTPAHGDSVVKGESVVICKYDPQYPMDRQPQCLPSGPAPPVDVPAIQQSTEKPKVFLQYPDGTWHPSSEYTCADKTRILLHDEQNPPKWWCHKSETN